MIRVLLADDHRLVTQGFEFLLQNEPDMEVVSSVNNGLKAVEAVKNQPKDQSIDVAVLDYDMPVMNGLAAGEVIMDINPEINIIILTMHKDELLTAKLSASKISGYITKDCDQRELLRAIRSVREGDSYYTQEGAKKVVNEDNRRNKVRSIYNLTLRELEVMKLIIKGYTSSQIGVQLSISPLTVKTHRKKILYKTGVKNSRQLMVFAQDRGIM